MTPEERAAEVVRDMDDRGLCAPSAEDAPIMRVMVAAAIRAAVNEALAVGGVPGVELTAEEVARIGAKSGKFADLRRMSQSHPDPAACADAQERALRMAYDLAFDVAALLSDRRALTAFLRDVAGDGTIDAWRKGYEAGRSPLLSLLEEVEWSAGDRNDSPRCPFCKRFQSAGNMHAAFCEFAKAMGRPTDGE